MRSATRLFLSLLLLVFGSLAAASGSVAAGTSHERAAQTKVLGKRHAFGPYSEGWGNTRPGRIYNGGDPSGLVRRISWNKWGGPRAVGRGKTSIFRPEGGYYAQAVTIRLRAADVGRCRSDGPPTYRKLWFRVPKRPGGPLGSWRLWSGVQNLCHPFS